MRTRGSGHTRRPVFIFDFGGVVIKWKNNNPIFDYIADRYGMPRAEMRRVFELALPRLETGDVSMRDFLEEALGKFGKRLAKGDSPDELWTLPFERLVKFRAGTVELVRSLRKRGYLVYLFSNTSIPHAEARQAEGVGQALRRVRDLVRAAEHEAQRHRFREGAGQRRREAVRGRVHRRQGGERQGREGLWDTLGVQVHVACAAEEGPSRRRSPRRGTAQ